MKQKLIIKRISTTRGIYDGGQQCGFEDFCVLLNSEDLVVGDITGCRYISTDSPEDLLPLQ